MSGKQTRMRLDQALVERGLVPTRARARDLVLRGEVRVGDRVAAKAGELVGAGDAIAVSPEVAGRVSRAAEKLIAGLDVFGFSAAGRVAIDVGASTGGFTQVLLERGASRVYAVDVGHGQLHAELCGDARVVNLEGIDARILDRGLVAEPVGAIVSDVSFISLTKALPAALGLAAPGCWLIALVKPQFEAGREAVGKGGIVRDSAVREAAVGQIGRFLDSEGWRVVGSCLSPLPGKDGNVEYLIGATRDGRDN